MTCSRALTAVLALAVLSPGVASASGVRFAARAEPLTAARSLAGGTHVLPARAAPFRFHLVGLHWRGAGSVWFRTASERGRWSAWRPARPEGEDLPDRGAREGRARAGWKVGNPYWTGEARLVQYRLVGPVRRLRANFVASAPGPRRVLAIPGTPRIIPRAAWGANEGIVHAPPSYAPLLRFAVVHHTAGTSPSSPSESAAIVRAIQAYHVLGNGWDDIGYNFLVDRFGQVFEGRRGGVTRNVIGAHARGFNTGSVGVAVLGNYGAVAPGAEAEKALASLLAWRLDLAHVDPLARLVANGVALRAVSGHRDTGATSCPGQRLYDRLPPIAVAASSIGLPKLYNPVVTGALGGPVRFAARLSQPLAWSVTVADAAGSVVGRGSGSGSTVDWTWNATAAAPGRYSYRIDAGAGVRPATGSLGAPLELTDLRAQPRVVTPNGDGVGERARISFSLSVAASVTVAVADLVGNPVRTLASGRAFRQGRARVVWNGAGVEDGRYRLVVTALAGASEVSRSRAIVVDRTLGRLAVRPSSFSPRRGRLAIGFELGRAAHVRTRVVRSGRTVRTVFSGALAAGKRTVAWNGRTRRGHVPAGRYFAVVEATTSLGTRRLARRFTVVR